MVRLVPLAPQPTVRTLGFLAGQGVLKADLKKSFSADIDAMFAKER